MCIFNVDVRHVGNTRILTGVLEDGRQVVVYRNVVQAAKGEDDEERDQKSTPAMILPFPLARDGSAVEFFVVDDDIFTDLARCFARRKSIPFVGCCSCSASENVDDVLHVQQVGSYNVSVAYSLQDLGRIDKSVFSLNPRVGDVLAGHYDEGFGFIVACFKTSDAPVKHPLAYAHSVNVEENGFLFIPTKHIHTRAEEGDDGEMAHFDHVVYSVGCEHEEAGETQQQTIQRLRGEENTDGTYVARGRNPMRALSRLPFVFRAELTSLRRLVLKGTMKNKDFLL